MTNFPCIISDSGQVLQQSHCSSNEIHWHWFSNKIWPECVLPFVKHGVFFFWNFRTCSKRYLTNGLLKTNHGMALNKNRGLNKTIARSFLTVWNCYSNHLIASLCWHFLNQRCYLPVFWIFLRCGMKKIKSQLWPY